MNLDQEFERYKKAKLSNYIDEAGVYTIMVDSVENSDEKKGYTGKPYFMFNVIESENNKQSKIFMFRVVDGDTEKSAEFKSKRILEFFTSLGIDIYTIGAKQAIVTAKGKMCNALFKESEKILKDKNNNMKPYIATVIEYSFSKPISQKITPSANYLFSAISAKERARFDFELAAWNKTYGGGAGTTQSSGDKNAAAFDQGMNNLEAGKGSVEFSVGSEGGDDDPF